MVRTHSIQVIFTLLLLFFTIMGINPAYAQKHEVGSFTDIRDGKIYKTVKIGEQWILAENFAFKPAAGNFWIYNNDTSNLNRYGYLYDWETAQKIAPKGWHLPTEADWKLLRQSLGGKRDVYKYAGGTMEVVYQNMITGGASGFNALLSGIRSDQEKFLLMGERTDFWSASASDDGQYFYTLDGKKDGKSHGLLDSTEGTAALAGEQDNAKGGKSVRLFKD